jgi:hypothetical protein
MVSYLSFRLHKHTTGKDETRKPMPRHDPTAGITRPARSRGFSDPDENQPAEAKRRDGAVNWQSTIPLFPVA